MKRLLLPTLLGVFYLVLLALPASAGLYDPRNPPPTPYINAPNGDNLSYGEGGWGDIMHSATVGEQRGSTIEQSEITNAGANAVTGIQCPLLDNIMVIVKTIFRSQQQKPIAGMK